MKTFNSIGRSLESLTPFILRPVHLNIAICLAGCFCPSLTAQDEDRAEPQRLRKHVLVEAENTDRPYMESYLSASLSLDGKEILVNSHLRWVAIYNSETRAMVFSSKDLRVINTWSDPQTGGVFMTKFPTDYGQESNKLSKSVTLFYYRNFGDVKESKPSWTHEIESEKHPTVQWLPLNRLFLLSTFSQKGKPQFDVAFLDENGNEVGALHIAGSFLGADEGANGIELFYVTGSGQGNRINVGYLTDDFKELSSKTPLYRFPLDARDTMIYRVAHRSVYKVNEPTRNIRFRGLKPGDSRRFFTEVLADPLFWSYQDSNNQGDSRESSPETDSLLMLRNLDRDHIKILSNFGNSPLRGFNQGILSAIDNPDCPEFVDSIAATLRGKLVAYPTFLVSRGGTLDMLTHACIIHDAVMTGTKMVMVASEVGYVADCEYRNAEAWDNDPIRRHHRITLFTKD
jgi:hypothetical protein